MPHTDINTPAGVGDPSDFGIEFVDHSRVSVGGHWVQGACIQQVLLQVFLVHDILGLAGREQALHGDGVGRVAGHVRSHDEISHALVIHGVHLVSQHAQHIESTQNGVRQINILHEGLLGIVPSEDRIRRRHDRASGVQGGHQASLGDGDGLLLHGFMDGCAVLLVHLVKLINQAQPAVSQHHRSAFQGPLTSGVVPLHGSGETNTGRALTGGVHHTVEGLLHVLQHLGLGTPGVSQQQHVDITTEPVALVALLRHSPKHRHAQRRLRMLVPVDRRGNRADDLRPDPPRIGHLVEAVEVRVGDTLQAGGGPVHDVVGLDHSVEHGETVAHGGEGGVDDPVGPDDLDQITRLHLVHQISSQDHLLRSWGTSRGHRARCLLQRDLLVVAVQAVLAVRLEGTSGPTLGAISGPDVVVTIGDEEGAQAVPALGAINVQLTQLWQHQGPLGNHPNNVDDGVDVDTPEGSDLIFHREIHQANENFGLAVVGGVLTVHHSQRSLMEQRQQHRRELSELKHQPGVVLHQILHANRQTLGILLSHPGDDVVVGGLRLPAAAEFQEELLEAAFDGPGYLVWEGLAGGDLEIRQAVQAVLVVERIVFLLDAAAHAPPPLATIFVVLGLLMPALDSAVPLVHLSLRCGTLIRGKLRRLLPGDARLALQRVELRNRLVVISHVVREQVLSLGLG
mmetsp:Transcript_56810/g.121982  ORF Transcript_56810/g.121982 Transcript_56810/m.121982 type:complete len:681 (-) Transcript_56810:69-2111(-)